jgi:uncharacterized membrane protein
MASWAAVLALTGFHYSAVEARMSFAAREGKHFWSTGYAWGTCTQAAAGGGYDVTLDVLNGELSLQCLVLTGVGTVDLGAVRTLRARRGITWHLGPPARTP